MQKAKIKRRRTVEMYFMIVFSIFGFTKVSVDPRSSVLLIFGQHSSSQNVIFYQPKRYIFIKTVMRCILTKKSLPYNHYIITTITAITGFQRHYHKFN
jgi:hypothetical protein